MISKRYTPQPGDTLVRALPGEIFIVYAAVTLDFIEGPIWGFPEAMDCARAQGPQPIWLDQVDHLGRRQGDAVLLPGIP